MTSDLWDIAFSQRSGQEARCSIGVAVPLKLAVAHKAVLFHSPPESMANTIDVRAHFAHVPPETPAGFPVAQVFREDGFEFDAPFVQGPVTDADAAQVKKCLDIALVQRKPVGESEGVLHDVERKTVSVGLAVTNHQPPAVKLPEPC